MEKRPGLQLTLSKTDKILEKTGLVLLVACWMLTMYVFAKSPDTIPVHFNASGQADHYGNKAILWILVVLPSIIYVVLSLIGKHPQNFNYLVRLTAKNAEQQYTISTRIIRFMKIAVLIIFLAVIFVIYLTVTKTIHGPGFWFFPFTIGLVLVPAAIMVVQSLKMAAQQE